MNIGYACVHIGSSETKLRSLRLKSATKENLISVTRSNLDALERMIEYNIENNIMLFRISSDIVPLGSHPANTLDWKSLFAERLERTGSRIKSSGMRVSMHPGQYTVLNSPDEGTAKKAEEDLKYHCAFLDSLGCGQECKIVLHAGGVYGDKKAAVQRFVQRYEKLGEDIRRRLVIENDERAYSVEDVLEISRKTGAPAVFDNLHHELNGWQSEADVYEWIDECAKTWKKQDGRQKIHYSQQAPDGRRGAHSQYIRTDGFLEFSSGLGGRDVDIMLEVKDKNLSAVKCGLLVQRGLHIRELEREWAKYKYLVLSKSASAYNKARQLLKDKRKPDAAAFYRLVESAFELEQDVGAGLNAAQHIWGYFKQKADEKQKDRFAALTAGYADGVGSYGAVKRFLFRLAEKYNETYLLNSLYFYIN